MRPSVNAATSAAEWLNAFCIAPVPGVSIR